MTGTLVLFVRLGSPVVELAVAMLVSEPLAGAVMVTVTLLIWPLVRAPRVQLTTPALLTPPPLAPTKVTLAGNASVTTTPLALEGPKLVTLIVYVRLLVALINAGPLLPMPTSATGVTVVMTGTLVLFVRLGSPVGELAVAMLVSEPLAGAVTVTVTLLIWPLIRLPRFHVTVPELFTPPPEALTKLTPAGNASVTTTPLALEGPKFVTLIVYVRLLVALTNAGPLLPIPTSATAVTVVMTGTLVLFVRLGSPVGELAVAMLVSEPLAGAVTVTVTLLIWPLIRLPRFHVTVPELFTPPPEALTKLTPAGRLSVTTTPLALEGPKLVTLIV